MQETHSAWVVAAGVLLVGMGLISSYYGVPEVVRSLVSDRVALKDDSEAMQRFRKTPQPLHFHVYLFNVENPEEVSRGAAPMLTEKGPYVYEERVDLQFHSEDDTLSYRSKSTYYFNKEKSGCRSENDVHTIIHAPILGTALKLQQVSPMGLNIFNDAVPLLFEAKNIFLKTSVRKLLFDGVFVNCSFPEDSFPAGAVCQGLRMRAPATYRRKGSDFYFSMFAHLNGTSAMRTRVNRGQRDASSVGKVVAVNGNTTLSNWLPGSPCNLLNGTDGTMFPPFQSGTRVLPIYTAASCRSLYLFYKNETELGGVPLMRFAIDRNMLASGKDYPPNHCFCVVPPQETSDAEDEEDQVQPVKEPVCLPKGAMDLSPCSGSPVILTFPHFYLGDESFLKYPTGLLPKEEDHETIVDIEPITGAPMRAKKRVQLNMFLKKIEDFELLSSVSEGLFPILWMEEGITLEGDTLSKVSRSHAALAVLAALPWVAVGLGVVLLVGGLLFVSGMAQKLCPACRPKPPKVQQQAKAMPTPLHAPGLGQYRLEAGFGAGDPVYAQKAHQFAANETLAFRSVRGGPGLGDYIDSPRQRPGKIAPY